MMTSIVRAVSTVLVLYETPRLPSEHLSEFSVMAYTPLGLGDHFLTSHTHLLAGVEALNGLLLICWSALFTYLAIER